MLYAGYLVVLLALSVYSYSQIDLNLTLSSNPIYQSIQHELILLGYYNRPLSTVILTVLLIFLYLIYLKILLLVKDKKLTVQNLTRLVLITVVILFFSYSALSHDLFNYMFDARIVTLYHQNPYTHAALDYPSDLWTRFMHWTHRTYPYGPLWLFLTLPFSFLGFGKFVVTLINFKLMFTAFYLGNVYLIYRILRKTDSKWALEGAALYAFNPVVLMESLVSPHNETAMLFFLLLAIYFLFAESSKAKGIFYLLLSGGIKFATLILLPLFFLIRKNKNPGRQTIWLLSFLALVMITLVGEIMYREPYAWYFIPAIGLGALLARYKKINILISGVSLAAFLRYLPFLYAGDYSKPVENARDLLFISVILLTFAFIGFQTVLKKVTFRKSL